jgi:cyclohexadieny/prephenate dehydrogenase
MSSAAIPARLLVVGFGLLGGSVALAARRRSPRTDITVLDPQAAAREVAREWGMESHAACPDRVDHDLVVLCAPFDGALRALGDLAPRVAESAVVTDVVGLKVPLVKHVQALAASYPALRYVGAHPMSGSHRRGARSADADLFAGAPCALVSAGPVSAGCESRVEAFWQALGCRTAWIGAEEHDAHVAATSALPQIVAAALAGAVRQRVGGADPALAGPGLRDTTRLAASPPELWAGPLVANRDAVLAAWRLFAQHCERWERALASGQREAVQRLLEEDRGARLTLFPDPESEGR